MLHVKSWGRRGTESKKESIGSRRRNLGAGPIDAKGTAQDYLTHPSRIPVQIMAAERLFSRGG